MDGAIFLFGLLFIIHWQCWKLVFFRFKAHVRWWRGVKWSRTQRWKHGYRWATDATRCFLFAEGGRGDGGRVLQHRQVCGTGVREIWRLPPAQSLILHSRPIQHLGSLLVVSFDVLDGRWEISFSPTLRPNQDSSLVSVLKHVFA
jgi:hypothetical protein